VEGQTSVGCQRVPQGELIDHVLKSLSDSPEQNEILKKPGYIDVAAAKTGLSRATAARDTPSGREHARHRRYRSHLFREGVELDARAKLPPIREPR
jgi:hypothetical protein